MTGRVTPALTASIRSGWRGLGRPQRLAVVTGSVLIAVGLAHLVGFAVTRGLWYGPLGWRKPFAFGVSFGITTATLGIASGVLMRSLRSQWMLCVTVAIANTVEVAWVSLQRARGVPSHFNESTGLDFALFIGAAVAVAATVAAIVVLAIAAIRAGDLEPTTRLAWRAGLGILLVSMAIGGVMIEGGVGSNAGSASPTTIPPAGQLKVPHAVGMHAIQVLPVLAWLTTFVRSLTERARLRLVAIATGGYVLLALASMVQTFAGRGLGDPGVLVAALAGLGVIGLAIAYTRTGLGLLRRA